jgi:hypothetical protein
VLKEGDDKAGGSNGAFFADWKSCDGNSGGHLGDGEEGVDSAEGFAGDGDAQDGKGCEGGGHSWKMGRTSGSGDDEAKTAFLGGAGVGHKAKWSAVGTDDADFGRDTGSAEKRVGRLKGGPIGPTSHDDSDERARALQENETKCLSVEVKNFAGRVSGKGLRGQLRE